MKSKICGISDSKTLKFLVNHPASPQFIGFIVNYPKSKRYVKISELKNLLKIDKKKIFICSSSCQARSKNIGGN